MLDLELISWGQESSAPIIFPPFIVADLTVTGLGTFRVVGNNLTASKGSTGVIPGTLIQTTIQWSTGILTFDGNGPADPITGLSITARGSSLAVNWQSFLGGDDTFEVGLPQGNVIDGGGGLNTVD